LAGAKVRFFPLTLLVVLTTVLRYRMHCDVKNIYRRRRMSRVRIAGAGGRRNATACRMQLRAVQFSNVPCLEGGDSSRTFRR